MSLQNSSLLQGNETAESDSMRLNPHIQYYSRVYVLSMGAALFLKTVRGLVFVKVIWSLLSAKLAHEIPLFRLPAECFIKRLGP